MSYEGVPTNYSTWQEWCRRLTVVANNTLRGKINAVFTCTLGESAASTTVSVPPGVLTNASFVAFMPTTANAAAELAAGGMYISARDPASNQFTVTHANNAQTDRTFTYVVLG